MTGSPVRYLVVSAAEAADARAVGGVRRQDDLVGSRRAELGRASRTVPGLVLVTQVGRSFQDEYPDVRRCWTTAAIWWSPPQQAPAAIQPLLAGRGVDGPVSSSTCLDRPGAVVDRIRQPGCSSALASRFVPG